MRTDCLTLFRIAGTLLHALPLFHNTALTAYARTDSIEISVYDCQAIGRVDRISQKNETTVFCFQTANTMDENVVKLQRKRFPFPLRINPFLRWLTERLDTLRLFFNCPVTKGLSIFKKAIEGEQAVFTTNATRRSEGKAEGEYKKAGADCKFSLFQSYALVWLSIVNLYSLMDPL